MAETVAIKNRKVRQEQLREQLSKGKHVEHVIDIAKQLLQPKGTLEALDIQRLKAAADIKLKLIAKYIPDLKHTDIDLGVEDGAALFTVKVIHE